MSEFESRGPTYAGPVAATGSLASQTRELSPQDRARDAIAAATRRVAAVRATLAELTAAHRANDLSRWNHARHEADIAIARAERQVDQMRGQLRDAPVDAMTVFETAALELIAESAAIQQAEPPAGYVVIELERELLAALRAPSVAGFAGRRNAVHAELEQLSIADLRVLRARIASPQPQDELAGEIWKLGRALRQEVASFIENVDRRKARERAAAAAGRLQPAPAPEPETVDTTLRRAVEGGNSEVDLLAVIATLDGGARRVLAMRLRTYRPGSGDDIAARFMALDGAVRQRVLAELASERRTEPMGPALAGYPGSVFALTGPAPAGPTAADIATQVDRAVELATGLLATGPLAPVRAKPEAYLKQHEGEAWAVVARYLERVSFPSPSPRAVWRDDVAFAAATVATLRGMHLFDRREALLEVLYPANPYAALAALIPIGDAWVPTVGSALAQLFEQAIVASLERLGPRWVDVAEHHPEPAGLADENQPLVAATALISSAPIDRAVREGMTIGGALALVGVAPKRGGVRPLRPVTLEWQGARDLQMWNWVRVSSPTDATAEEVAAALWTSDRATEHATEHAYGLTVSGSFFGVPASWARQFAAAKAFAPAGHDATASEQLVHLAAGTHADELALDAAAHTSRAKPRPGAVTGLLDDVQIQLAHLVQLFAPWGLDADIATAIHWITGKQHELALAHDDERATWAPIIADQKERVYRIADAVRALAASAKSAPMKRILALYARATATSFLGAASERLIASAVQEQTMLTLGAVRASTNDLAMVVGDGAGLDSTQVSRAEEIASEARLLQTSTLAGKAVDPDDVERITLSTQELALHLRIEQIRHQLRALGAAAAQATDGKIALAVAAFPGKFHDLAPMTAAFENQLRMVESAWTYDVSGASQIRDPDEYGREMSRLRRTALATAQARFATIKTDDGLTTFLQHGASVIEHELRVVGWVTACVQLLVLIGVGMVASAAGSAVAETVAAWGASAEAVESVTTLARATRTLGRLGGLATEAALNTAGQRMFKQPGDDTSFVEGMAENALMSFGSNVILSRIGSSLEFAKDIERSTGSLWASTKVAGAVMLAKGVTISSHVIINAATAYVAHQIVKRGHAEPSNATLTEWFMQGAAVAIGRYVHGQISGRRELYAKLAALHEFESAKRLLRDGDALLARVTAIETSPGDHDALELLARQRALLSDEIAVLEAAASDPAKARALELTAPTLRGMKRFAQATLVELDATNLAELPLRSAHLDELVPGEVWKGTPAQIDAAIAAAGRARIPVEAERSADGVWRIKLGAREVTVHEAMSGETHASPPGHEPPGDAIEIAERTQVGYGARTPREKMETVSLAEQHASIAMAEHAARGKALPEQHAHVQGSVPINAVLSVVAEQRGTTREVRAQQIDLLENLIRAATEKGTHASTVTDLSPTSTRVEDGVVKAPETVVIASIEGQLEVGLLNKMLTATRTLQEATPGSQEAKTATKNLDEALTRYRRVIVMQKPDGARYGASIQTGDEFFARYKMIIAHDLTIAEIAAKRASGDQLGMQELRFSPKGKGLDALGVEAAALLARQPDGADVSLTYAPSKNGTSAEDVRANEQQRATDFVKEWYRDPKLQRMFNGIDSAGVEHVQKPPATRWESSAQRTFRNAIVMREHLAAELHAPADVRALAERVARITGESPARATELLHGYRAGAYESAITATEVRSNQLAGQDAALRARRTIDPGTPWAPALPAIDPATGQLNERFGGLSIEEVATETRILTEALATWSAETGRQHAEVTLLGDTYHAGEQLLNKNVDPFVLLDQVDQAVSLGADRIGHGLVLGVDADVLITKGVLTLEQRAAFVARQQQVVARVRARGVVIEANMSSNQEISNLTHGEHPAGRFVEEGLRVTINTDDETVLGTDMRAELVKVARAKGIGRAEMATMMLEGYRSRMGNRELQHRDRIKVALLDAIVGDASLGDRAAIANYLSDYFRVQPAATSTATIQRVLDLALGL